MESYSVHLKGFTLGAETFRGSLIMQGLDVDEVDRLVSSVPCLVKSSESRGEAEKLKRFYEAAGGVVEVRGGDVVEVETADADPFALPPMAMASLELGGAPGVEVDPFAPPPASAEPDPFVRPVRRSVAPPVDEPVADEPALDLLEPAPAPAPAPAAAASATPQYCPRCDLGPLAAGTPKCKRCGQLFGEAAEAAPAPVPPSPVTPRPPAASAKVVWEDEDAERLPPLVNALIMTVVAVIVAYGVYWAATHLRFRRFRLRSEVPAQIQVQPVCAVHADGPAWPVEASS